MAHVQDLVEASVRLVESGKSVSTLAGASEPASGGAYSDVAVLDDVVVKRWYKEDRGYEAFLQFVLDCPTDAVYYEHLPKVIWHSFELRLVLLEKLEATDQGLNEHLPYNQRFTCFDKVCFIPEKNSPAWATALMEEMKSLALEHRCFVDGHSGNWMIRQEGHRRRLVVTDPLAPSDCGSL